MKEFLGPYGASTIVLFTSQFDSELPRLSEVKRLLQVPDGAFYRSTGHHSGQIARLEQLLGILRSTALNPDSGYHYRGVHLSTDYLITVANVPFSLFAALKYAAQLVAGFNLTNDAITDLGQLLERYRRVCGLRNRCSSWPETLQEQITQATTLGIKDPSILEADIEAVHRVTENYGLAAIQVCKDALQQWYDTYRWNVAPSSTVTEEDAASQSDLETQSEPLSV